MKAVWSWLLELCDLPNVPTVEEGARALTAGGLEIEGVVDLGAGFRGVIVAEVVAKRPHPGSDKLTLVDVITARGDQRIRSEFAVEALRPGPGTGPKTGAPRGTAREGGAEWAQGAERRAGGAGRPRPARQASPRLPARPRLRARQAAAGPAGARPSVR